MTRNAARGSRVSTVMLTDVDKTLALVPAVLAGDLAPSALPSELSNMLSRQVYLLACDVLSLGSNRRMGEALDGFPAEVGELVRKECRRLTDYRKQC